MYELIIFTIEVGISVAISYSVVRLIRPYLHNVLVESCGTGQRADFWGILSLLMIYIAPLLIVIFFTNSVNFDVHVALSIKDALFRSLLGQFIALAAIAWVIWQTILINHTQAKSTESK